MVELLIEQQFGRIGLDIQPAEYNIRIQPATLKIKQIPAQIRLEQPAAILEIDYTLVRETLGYRNIDSQAKYFTAQAKAAFEEGLEREVAEGHKLGHIEKNISIGQIASEAFEPKEKQLTLEYLPFPEIKITEQPVIWDVQNGGVELEYIDGDVKVDMVKPWNISVYWEQKPYIKIKAVGWAIDVKA